MTGVYPSFEELTPGVIRAVLPVTLYDVLEQRYKDLGPRYLTDQFYNDGRQINGCMFKSSVQDCLEEVVDAIFNTMVWMFKERIGLGDSDNSVNIFHGLVAIFTSLAIEREAELDQELVS